MQNANRGRFLAISTLICGFSLGCATATPEQTYRAERECFAEARHDGYSGLELVGTPVVVGNEVIASLKGRRHREDFTGTCTYDQQRRHANVSMTHSSGGNEWVLDKSRDACRLEAEDRRFTVEKISDERVDRGHVRLNMDLRRRNRDFYARCYYENGRAELEIERY